MSDEFNKWAEQAIKQSAASEPVPDDPTRWDSRSCRRGDPVLFRDAGGAVHAGRALGSWRQGHKFPVVPVCREAEWQESRPSPMGRAWPAEDVVPDLSRSRSGETR